MACRLTLLGPPQLLDEQGRLIPIPAKAFALAAYILLTNGGAPTSRAVLCGSSFGKTPTRRPPRPISGNSCSESARLRSSSASS